jgi:hypothetical protein
MTLAFILAGPAHAQREPVPEEELRTAEQEFREGLKESPHAKDKLRRAASRYYILAGRFDDAELHLNAGNAYLLADDLPSAIWAYRRGLQRYPLNGELWANLELARDQVAYPGGNMRERPPGDDWPPMVPRPNPGAVLYSALALYLFGWIAVTAWLMTRRRPLGMTAVCLFTGALLMAGLWGWLQYHIAEDIREPLVVVVRNGVALRRGNGPLYPRHPDLPQVNRGMEARLLGERGEWFQVRFPGGEVGWLPADAVYTYSNVLVGAGSTILEARQTTTSSANSAR